MLASKINISEEQIKEEQLKGARLSVYFRWALIGLLSVLLSVQYFIGYKEMSGHAIIIIVAYIISNIFFRTAVKKQYNPRYLSFLSGTIDIGIICYHIYSITVLFDPYAATATATIFLIPIIFLIYTFRLDKGLLIFMITISAIGFNYIFFSQYFNTPELYSKNIYLSPISHIFKTVYIISIGLLCIYMQSSIFKFIRKQLAEANERSKIDTGFKLEQEKNKYSKKLIEKEKLLNKELEKEIREKDKLANQIKENKEQLKSIIYNLLGFTYRCKYDDTFTMLFVSDQVEDVSGYKASDLLHNSNIAYSSLIYPDDMDHVRKHISKALNNNKPFDIEYRIKDKNGNLVWVHETGRGVYDVNHNLLYIDGIITDITTKKQVENELKETQDLINTLISNLVSAVSRCLFDEKLTALFYSEKIYDITGYHATDFINNRKVSFAQIIHNEDVALVRKKVDEAIENKKPYAVEFRIIHRSGKIVWVYENGQPVFDKNEKLLYLDGITTDISDKKIAEKELIKTKQELEKLNKELEKTIEERTTQLTATNTKLLELQKENQQSQFEVLKQQVNPHFLFNSLNVLTSLIKIDPSQAESFTERLSKVYRYILEYKEKDLVTLNTEMDCIRAYVFLLDIRFAKKVFVKINLNENFKGAYVVPLALQLLIENAIKHNTFSKKNPLNIELFIDNDNYLNVTNNLQSRETRLASTGIGLVNISKRYSLISEKQPVFEEINKKFVAKIPLIFTGE